MYQWPLTPWAKSVITVMLGRLLTHILRTLPSFPHMFLYFYKNLIFKNPGFRVMWRGQRPNLELHRNSNTTTRNDSRFMNSNFGQKMSFSLIKAVSARRLFLNSLIFLVPAIREPRYLNWLVLLKLRFPQVKVPSTYDYPLFLPSSRTKFFPLKFFKDFQLSRYPGYVPDMTTIYSVFSSLAL